MTKTKFPGSGFGTFWMGPSLSALERVCLLSFVESGYSVTLFSYGGISNVPLGVAVEDAGLIVPVEMTTRFTVGSKPSLAHFSDYFRYYMILKRKLIWIDADMLFLGNHAGSLERPSIFCKEEQGGINGAIIYTGDVDLLECLIKGCEEKAGGKLLWGETGPKLVAKCLQNAGKSVQAYDFQLFYPIEYYDLYKMLLPEFNAQCEQRCREAITLHLFNNILTSMGYWKDIAPPIGSFLHNIFRERNLLQHFSGVYPENVMRACLDNFLFRQNGKALGIRSVLKEMVPSVARTYRHYTGTVRRTTNFQS